MNPFRSKRCKPTRGFLIAGLLALGTGPLSAQEALPSGGWHLDEGDFALKYRPVSHADPMMTAWINLAAEHQGTSASARQVFQKLTNRDSQGRCSKCHGMELTENQSIQVHWTYSDTSRGAISKFSHIPHLIPLSNPAAGDQSCTVCHQLQPAGDKPYASNYHDDFQAVKLDASMFRSEFAPIQQAQCAECHTPELAGDSCMLCHTYHLNIPRPSSGKLDDRL